MKMILVILAILALMIGVGVASAETLKFGNFTANFDMKQPHIIDANSIRTYYGWIHFNEDDKVNEIQFIGQIKLNNSTTCLYVEKSGNYLVSANQAVNVRSTMNLSSTIDFFKTLKIERIKH